MHYIVFKTIWQDVIKKINGRKKEVFEKIEIDEEHISEGKSNLLKNHLEYFAVLDVE